jgi:hypothetical protein
VSTLLTVLGAAVLFAVGAALADLCSKELRGRLDQVPQALLKAAARRAPEPVRDELREEWLGELHQFLHGADALPVTRLWRGLRYSTGLLCAVPKIVEAGGAGASTKRRSAGNSRPPFDMIAFSFSTRARIITLAIGAVSIGVGFGGMALHVTSFVPIVTGVVDVLAGAVSIYTTLVRFRFREGQRPDS